MPVQKGRSGESSQKTEQMSGSKWSLFLQQVEKEGPRPRASPPAALACCSRFPQLFPHSPGAPA